MCEHYYHFDSQNHGVCIFCGEEWDGKQSQLSTLPNDDDPEAPPTWLWKVAVIVTTVVATLGLGIIIKNYY